MNSFKEMFTESITECLDGIDVSKLQEIKIRAYRPIIIYFNNKEFFISKNKKLTAQLNDNCLIANQRDIKEVLETISKHSLYAYEEDIKGGYITIEGGHRIGIAGKVILEKGRVKTIRNVSSINIRVSHEVKGCATILLPYLIENNMILHTLIVSPPKCGKTTLLRDLIRQISDGTNYLQGMTVGLVDERSEIGGCYRGIPQNDIGIRTDVLDGCSKGEGLLMLIRAMAPRVIAVDEIGSKEDVDAIEYALSAGCKIICTIHGDSLEAIKEKPRVQELVERKLFKRYVFLESKKNISDIKKIYDENHNLLIELMDERIKNWVSI